MRDEISSCTKTLHDCYIIQAFSPTVHDIDLCKIGVHSVRSPDALIPAPTNHTIFHSFSDPFLRTISLTCSSLPFRQFVARPILPTLPSLNSLPKIHPSELSFPLPCDTRLRVRLGGEIIEWGNTEDEGEAAWSELTKSLDQIAPRDVKKTSMRI